MTELEAAEIILQGYSCTACVSTGKVTKSEVQVHDEVVTEVVPCGCSEVRDRHVEARLVLDLPPLPEWSERLLEGAERTAWNKLAQAEAARVAWMAR